MTKKMKKESGFTLVEMLIVVAIIAILIAVSIPMVTGALDRAKEATDAANVRAAKAQAAIAYLSDQIDEGKAYVYDAVKGSIETSATTGYGKTEKNDGVVDGVIYITVYDGSVYYQWAAKDASITDPGTTSAPTGDWKIETPVIDANKITD